jgi:hypothetical protein
MFHANDIHAARVAQFLKATSNIRTICLASDVYSAQAYLELDATTDVFVAPSTMHLNGLRSFLSTPVVLIPEGIDPIALPPPGSSQLTPNRNARILWFGYPESFAKSLGLVLPQAMARSGLPTEALTLITDGGEGLLPGAAVQRFDIDHFYSDSSVARHALLSHFSFDMHMNSHIKTENKLITALVRGLIPVFSATPNYLECARRYELEHLTFTGLDSLTDLLKAVAQESLPDVNFSAITRHIVAERSPERLAGLLLNRL